MQGASVRFPGGFLLLAKTAEFEKIQALGERLQRQAADAAAAKADVDVAVNVSNHVTVKTPPTLYGDLKKFLTEP